MTFFVRVGDMSSSDAISMLITSEGLCLLSGIIETALRLGCRHFHQCDKRSAHPSNGMIARNTVIDLINCAISL